MPTTPDNTTCPGWRAERTPPFEGPLDVSVCIANWNCRDMLRACLESLHEQPQGVQLETIVVDNASSDGAADMVAHEFPHVILIRNATNRGFAQANNQAAAVARGRFLFFLNNDTVVPPHTLSQLLTYAEAHPEAGMIGPGLRGADGEMQISYRQKPTVYGLLHRTALLRWTGLFRSAYRRYRRQGFAADRRRSVDLLMGAAVFMPQVVFAATGGWDEHFTFGGEDLDLSARVGRDHELVYLPDIEITHYGRVSTRQNIGFTAPSVLIGYVQYLRKSGATERELLLYKTVITLDVPVQAAAKLVQTAWRMLLGRRDEARKSWLAVQGLLSFLGPSVARFWRA
jgi:hypothetical protein